jgi:hypothetical protein
MISLGLGLGLSQRRLVGGWRDPLAGLPVADFRFQTASLNPATITGYRDCIVVTGAGTAAANGRYYEWPGDHGQMSGTTYYVKTQGISLPGVYMHAGQNRWMVRADASNGYQQSTPGLSSPTIGPYIILGGGVLPAPTVTLIQEPQYAPRGIVAIPGAANPTISDVWTPGGLVLTQAASLLQGTTQIVNGVPVLRLDGAGDKYIGSYSSPHTRGDYTIVSLARKTTNGGYQPTWYGASADAAVIGGVPILGEYGAGTQWGVSQVGNAGVGACVIEQGAGSTAWQVTVARRSGSGTTGMGGTIKVWGSGTTAQVTQIYDSGISADFTVGARPSTSSFGGDIAAVIHWRTALTDDQIENVIMPYLETIRASLIL